MSSNPPVKMKWLEHLNAMWVGEASESLGERTGVSDLYERLLSNQEVVGMPQQVLQLKGPPLPEYEQEAPSVEEQEHYLDTLLASQLSLARAVCSDSPFAAILQKRLVVIQRIFHAVSRKYHDRERVWQQHQQEEGISNAEDTKTALGRARSGTDALIEMGVKTGLSLIFSLLRQNWGENLGGKRLCNDVLQTALEVICSLPPLSLANESKLPMLGLSTLSRVTLFLKSVTLPSSEADLMGKRLASELVLALGAQRGSLRYLLEWIEMALCASVSPRQEDVSSETQSLPSSTKSTEELSGDFSVNRKTQANEQNKDNLFFSVSDTNISYARKSSDPEFDRRNVAFFSDSVSSTGNVGSNFGQVDQLIPIQKPGMITYSIFMDVMQQMKKTAVSTFFVFFQI